jgi:LmbE family N-acetylglucosaminyl deacetylase
MHEIKSKRMLVVLAHPDDESFSVGGTLAKYAAQDVQVVLLSATCGEAAVSGAALETACEKYERELKLAGGYLGIETYFLGYPADGLASMTTETMTEAIGCWMDLVQPQVIITFGPEGFSGHPDHILISSIVTRVYDSCYKKGLLLYACSPEATLPDSSQPPTNIESEKSLVVVDVSGYKLNKLHAIQCHAGQNTALPASSEEALGTIASKELFRVARDLAFEGERIDWFERPLDAYPKSPQS